MLYLLVFIGAECLACSESVILPGTPRILAIFYSRGSALWSGWPSQCSDELLTCIVYDL